MPSISGMRTSMSTMSARVASATRLRDEEREKLVELTAQLRSESAEPLEQEVELEQQLMAVPAQARQLNVPPQPATTRNLGALRHTYLRNYEPVPA
ncbi:hypothetical protein AB0383_08590 [Amycolatopsis sp. NPDC051373]|uniref:hypothetical protein n=1 Tax=Amycolatopsis sp. NPDC051373 TaxID=3155801 RepID=UPI00344E2399